VSSSLELRGTTFDPTTYVYATSAGTEVVDVGGLARLEYDDEAVNGTPSIIGNPLHVPQLHVLLSIKDFLGSSSLLIDLDTGELAENRTYLPFGETEADYRPSRWNGMRDDYGFTGKEEDIEVGLQYFGARYLAPALGRWISADPLALHGLGADPNVYAYVHGSVFAATDPNGLDSDWKAEQAYPAMLGYIEGAEAALKQKNLEGLLEAVKSGRSLFRAFDKEVQTSELGKGFLRALSYFEQRGLAELAEQPKVFVDVNDPAAAAESDRRRAFMNAVTTRQTSSLGGWAAVTAATESYRRGDSAKDIEGWANAAENVADIAGGYAGFAKHPLPSPERLFAPADQPQGGAPTTVNCFTAGTRIATADGDVAIEAVHVGTRVLTGTESDSAGETDVSPATWSELSIRMPTYQLPDDVLELELLRPNAWVQSVGAREGAWISLALDELNIRGFALVTALHPAPLVPPGPGHVVLATMNHLNDEVMVLRFDGSKEPLELTPGHPLWSPDTGAWIAAGELVAGQHLSGLRGWVTISSIEPKPGVHRIFNLEVEHEHVFRVSSLGILAHNQSPNRVLVLGKDTEVVNVGKFLDQHPDIQLPAHQGVVFHSSKRGNIGYYPNPGKPVGEPNEMTAEEFWALVQAHPGYKEAGSPLQLWACFSIACANRIATVSQKRVQASELWVGPDNLESPTRMLMKEKDGKSEKAFMKFIPVQPGEPSPKLWWFRQQR
jgi:RHS repeat-associated protein